ncbi:DUF389 domain-containing protein [Flexivirga sp. B27]
MLVHLRLTAPADLAGTIVRILEADECVTNLVVLQDVCRDPRGDLIECDCPRESAGTLVDALDDAGLGKRGGILISRPSSTPFRRAEELEAAAPGDPDDAVIWDEVLDTAESASRPTVSYHLFLVMATILAAIAVITDSSVLVVGVMVVSPDFAPVAALCTGVVFARPHLVWRSARLLVLSFVFAIAVVTILALLARAGQLLSVSDVTADRPQTEFIWHPDKWTFIVALIAGAVGVFAMSTDKAAAMVGVFISVTTVPAAGNLALGLATGSGAEIGGSATQLGLNPAGMVVAGVAALGIQRLGRSRLERRRSRTAEPLS